MIVDAFASQAKQSSACTKLGTSIIGQDTIQLLQQLVVALGNITAGGGGGGGAALPTGTRIEGYWLEAPSGYVLAQGGWIGDADSNADERANADCEALFMLLWDMYNTRFGSMTGTGVLRDSGGALVNTLGSAADDWAANFALKLPGGPGLVTVAAGLGTLDGQPLVTGAEGGEENHTLIEAELPVVAGHSHSQPAHDHGLTKSTTMVPDSPANVTVVTELSGSFSGGSTQNGGGEDTGSAGGFGSGQAHNNVQPFEVVTVAIKL